MDNVSPVLGLVRKAAAETVQTQETVRVQSTRVRCWKCNGSGIFSWGIIDNGKPQFSGKCFRCEGKGYQTDADERRNDCYDNWRSSWAL